MIFLQKTQSLLFVDKVSSFLLEKSLKPTRIRKPPKIFRSQLNFSKSSIPKKIIKPRKIRALKIPINKIRC